MTLTRVEIRVTEEKRIVTGMITSAKFIENIRYIFNPDYFCSTHLKVIANWCYNYFEAFKKAPNKAIDDILTSKTIKMNDTEREFLEDILGKLGEDYYDGMYDGMYYVDMTEKYFRKRELEITVNNISVLSEKGDLEAAEKEIEKFQKVSLDINSQHIINMGDIETVERIYKKRDEEEKNFFKLPGDLGRYLGNQKRGDVVSYYGPAKRGKSWTLINNYKHGVLSKKRTLFWSIEMTDTEVLPRLNKAFYPMTDMESGMYDFPEFDCIHNQSGNCADRLSNVCVRESDDDDDDVEIEKDPSHVVCTKCKGHKNIEVRKKYKQTTYKSSINREKDDIFAVRKLHKKYKKMWNQYGRTITHPKYSLTYDMMMRDVDTLEKREDWHPDIIIIDYIDILEIGSRFDDYRQDDEKWKLLAKIAGKLDTLVITATQANKAGHSAKTLTAEHQGGFYGKNRHVNLMVGLNQEPKDKKEGIMNFGITEARNIEYIPGQVCSVLQDFKTGQAYLDSYYPYF